MATRSEDRRTAEDVEHYKYFLGLSIFMAGAVFGAGFCLIPIFLSDIPPLVSVYGIVIGWLICLSVVLAVLSYYRRRLNN